MDALDLIRNLQKRETHLVDDVKNLTEDCFRISLAVSGSNFCTTENGQRVVYHNEKLGAQFTFNRATFPKTLLEQRYGERFIASELAKCIVKKCNEQGHRVFKEQTTTKG